MHFPSQPRRAGGVLSWLFGRLSVTAPAEESVEARVHAWADRNRSLGMQLHRTAAGFRLMITSSMYSPSELLAAHLVKDLAVDERYVTLCRSQKSFRARLTTKPWRCTLTAPPSRWLYPIPEAEAQFKAWLNKHESQIQSYASCPFVAALRSKEESPSIAPILSLHTTLSKAEASLPLAYSQAPLLRVS
jgi:hypothetical protein